jgi:hypothetical protein
LLLSERSAVALAWRFDSGRREPWKLCSVSDDAGVPAGWFVWRPVGQDAEVGDFFVADPQRQTGSALIVFANMLREEGIAAISMEMLAPPEVDEALLAAGLSRRGDAMPLFARASHSGGFVLPPADRWYLTRFDNDSD